jgi:hypothetical protein
LNKIQRILFLSPILVGFSLLSSSAREKFNQPTDKDKRVLFRIPVWTSNGTPMPGTSLGIEDFKVLNGKSSLKISSLLGPDSPMLLFIAFDTVGDINNINRARAGVIQELEALGQQYWTGLILAQEQLAVLQEPTADRQLLKQKVEELTQIGKAGLLESIEPIADLTTGILLKTDVRVAVVLITDSDIGNYRADYLNPPVNASDTRDLSRRFAGRALQEKISRMTASLARHQVPIFIVHIDPGLDPLNLSYHNGLKQLAESVGGQCFLSKTISDIEPMIREAFRWAKSYYLLGFSLSGAKSGYIRIHVLPSNEEAAAVAGRLTYPGKLFCP